MSSSVSSGRRKGMIRKVPSTGVNCKPSPPADMHKAAMFTKRSITKESKNCGQPMFSKMSAASVSAVHHDQRKGTIINVNAAEVNYKPIPPEDLHKATVISTSDWEQIKESASGVDRERERLIAAAKQREELSMRSKEAVKKWPNSFAAQKQNVLEEKKIREEVEEEEKKKIDLEEEKYKEEKRKEAIERAKNMLLLQTSRVKGVHSALMQTEVMEERAAQVELKKRNEKAAKELAIEMQKAQIASNIAFKKMQLDRAQKRKEAVKRLQDTQIHQRAEKHAQEQRLKDLQKEFEAKNVEINAEDDKLFIKYAKQVIQKVSKTQRNTCFLRKAAEEGVNEEYGLTFVSVRPRYEVLDQSAVQMHDYVHDSAKAIKELRETTDIQEAKDQLGFAWFM